MRQLDVGPEKIWAAKHGNYPYNILDYCDWGIVLSERSSGQEAPLLVLVWPGKWFLNTFLRGGGELSAIDISSAITTIMIVRATKLSFRSLT